MAATEVAPPSASIQEAEAEIRSGLPAFEFENIQAIGDGWDHIAVEADGIIFRLPKDHKRNFSRENHVRYETAALEILAGRLHVKIPHPEYISRDHEFFGYRKLDGVFASEAKDRFSAKQAARHLDNWVQLASEIHVAISPEEALGIGVPRIQFEKHINDAASILELDDAPTQVMDFAKQTVEDAKRISWDQYRQVFLHNDLHNGNILLDPDTLSISGVIDWSDMIVGPLESEFSRIVDSDSVKVQEVAERYQKLTGINIDVPFAITIQRLLWARIYAYQIKRNDKPGAEDTVKKISRYMENEL